MTSNCLIEPRPKYKHRIFTMNSVGWENIKRINNKDFSDVIKCALEEEGFTEKTIKDNKSIKQSKYTIGFGHKTVLDNANLVLNGIQKGEIKDIFVIGGCDGSEGARN